MKKKSILIDLKVALNNGYCGIATENRLIYKMLASSEQIKTNGLLISNQVGSVFSHYKKTDVLDVNIRQANNFLHQAIGHELTIKQKLGLKLKLDAVFALKKRHFDMYPMDAIYHDAIWRNIFDKTLQAADKFLLDHSHFYFSDLTNQHLRAATFLKKNVHLNTGHHDVALFLEPQAIRVSTGTLKVVRYHDSIPISDPDFATARFSYGKMNTLDLAAKDSYFVCNSEPTLTGLLRLKPELEGSASVIPCPLATNYQHVNDEAILKQILITRLSSQLMNESQRMKQKIAIEQLNDMQYVFHLAAFDPKKNQANLIRAFEIAHYHSGGQLKLVIAANPGIFSEETKRLMQPHLETGAMIHLSHLSADEMPYLYSHAKAFLFPSYIEGFGLPPLEAMQCRCPVLVSDIAAHRWVLGEAAVFCNPYDVHSIADGIMRITREDQALTQQRIQAGLNCAKQYTTERLAQKWLTLLNQLMQRRDDHPASGRGL